VKTFKYMKDGGAESKVSGLFLIEIKSLFSVALLHFSLGSREAYHSHAFNSVSWVLNGRLDEYHTNGKLNSYEPGLKPVLTKRSTFHKVFSVGDTWVLTFRGPWFRTWKEFIPATNQNLTLTHGRKIVPDGF
jgi:hypothetical protein